MSFSEVFFVGKIYKLIIISRASHRVIIRCVSTVKPLENSTYKRQTFVDINVRNYKMYYYVLDNLKKGEIIAVVGNFGVDTVFSIDPLFICRVSEILSPKSKRIIEYFNSLNLNILSNKARGYISQSEKNRGKSKDGRQESI